MEPEKKNIPAIHAVIRHASVAATKALNPIAAMSFFRDGARAATPPTKIAIDAMCANPQSAYAVMIEDLGSLSNPFSIAYARWLYETTSVTMVLSPIIFETV